MSTDIKIAHDQIKAIVAEVLEIEPVNLTDTGNFEQNYNADSLRAIEILAALERELKIEIPQEELSRMINMLGVYEVVEQYSGQAE
ncbi:MAG: acyl carrier protein [Cyanobacteria bacterium P01_H01_bin.105]